MNERSMPAILIRETGKKGDWNALAPGRTAIPALKAGEALVRVEACSVNRADLLQRRGLYPPPPGASSILGLDFAGVVVESAPGAARPQPGERVFGIVAGGGYGRYVAVPADHLVPVPGNLDFVQAAAAAEVFFTAFHNLFAEAGLAAGETLLIHGGGSGVGTAANSLARSAHASAIVTAGEQQKLDRCMALGASFGVSYREEGFFDRIRKFTGGAGVDVILDWIGASYLSKHIEILKPKGRIVLIGLMGGHKTEISLAPFVSRRLRLIGSVLRSQSREEKAALTLSFRERALPLLASGEVHPVVDKVFSIPQVEEAHEYLREGKHFGKVVLTWEGFAEER